MSEKPKLETGSEKQEEKKISAETTFEFKEGEFSGKWLEIRESGNAVEGKLYLPKDGGGNKIIIFHPGLPGDAVEWFEEKHVQPLLADGYTVFVARHAGLILDQKNERYIHSADRRAMNDRIVGDDTKEVSVNDWLKEPELTLKYFAPDFKSIGLVTHSFSGLSGAISLSRLNEQYNKDLGPSPLAKVNKWLILSGFASDFRGDYWDPNRKFFNAELMQNFFKDIRGGVYQSGDPQKMLEQLKQASSEVKNKIRDLPKHIGVIGVYPEQDRILSIQSGLDLQNNLGRGLVIDDKTFRQERFSEQADAHDFPHLKPEVLTRLIEMHVPPTTKRVAQVKKSD